MCVHPDTIFTGSMHSEASNHFKEVTTLHQLAYVRPSQSSGYKGAQRGKPQGVETNDCTEQENKNIPPKECAGFHVHELHRNKKCTGIANMPKQGRMLGGKSESDPLGCGWDKKGQKRIDLNIHFSRSRAVPKIRQGDFNTKWHGCRDPTKGKQQRTTQSLRVNV
ncbi:hypothetical protein B0H19DRAFT_1083431 [Mycena capillaripes]|nr:hypothetical protein B0H19DRAFT_1083431 [Mycena capillaripes]